MPYRNRAACYILNSTLSQTLASTLPVAGFRFSILLHRRNSSDETQSVPSFHAWQDTTATHAPHQDMVSSLRRMAASLRMQAFMVEQRGQ